MAWPVCSTTSGVISFSVNRGGRIAWPACSLLSVVFAIAALHFLVEGGCNVLFLRFCLLRFCLGSETSKDVASLQQASSYLLFRSGFQLFIYVWRSSVVPDVCLSCPCPHLVSVSKSVSSPCVRVRVLTSCPCPSPCPHLPAVRPELGGWGCGRKILAIM